VQRLVKRRKEAAAVEMQRKQVRHLDKPCGCPICA
jgi:hypothetical protein